MLNLVTSFFYLVFLNFVGVAHSYPSFFFFSWMLVIISDLFSCFVFLDEDVLDTWFSSGLLPFSIFGWPDKVNLNVHVTL